MEFLHIQPSRKGRLRVEDIENDNTDMPTVSKSTGSIKKFATYVELDEENRRNVEIIHELSAQPGETNQA